MPDDSTDLALEYVLRTTNGCFSTSQKQQIAELIVGFYGQQRTVVTGSDYRVASLRLLTVLSNMDTMMMSAPNIRIAWHVISFALGLQSTAGKTEKVVARECQCGHGNFSKKVCEFLRMTGLEPSFGLKSNEAKKAYSECRTR